MATKKKTPGRKAKSTASPEGITDASPKPKPRKVQGSTVEAYGNTWTHVVPSTTDDLHRAQHDVGVLLPADLAELLQRCGGGHPMHDFFEGIDTEISIGYLLPLADHPKLGSLSSRVHTSRQVQGLPLDYVPFAVDAGHANVLCLHLPTGKIIYWLHDDQQAPLRHIAPSLATFLSGLEEAPF